MSVRALRNSNPGNLEAGDHWQGLLPRQQMTDEQRCEGRFAVFRTPAWGFRALAIVLLNYEIVHHLKTVRGWIERWAPPEENDTEAYIAAVCRALNVRADDEIDLRGSLSLERVCKAIATHECGSWLFSNADLSSGVAMAEASV